jgi:transposase
VKQSVHDDGQRGALKELREFVAEAKARGDLDTWRRGRGIIGYIEGRRVVELAGELDVTRGSVNRWLQWYEALGVEGLLTGTAPGPAPKLPDAQRAELTLIIEAGPLVAGHQSGVWTGPMIGDVIEQRFDVRYHTRPPSAFVPTTTSASRAQDSETMSTSYAVQQMESM